MDFPAYLAENPMCFLNITLLCRMWTDRDRMSTKANMQYRRIFFIITLGNSRCQIKMRTLVKIVHNDSCVSQITFYSLMYEAENMKHIVKFYLDIMMESYLKCIKSEKCDRPP